MFHRSFASSRLASPGALPGLGGAARACALPLLLAAVACGSPQDQRPAGRVERAASTIAFVQLNYKTPQSPAAMVNVPYTAAQTAGNLNVVAVGWNDTTTQVASVTDTKGNVYQRAVGPTVRAGSLTQSIYYAAGIAAAAAGANAVSVSFNAPAEYADVRIVEYSGVDPVSPVDVVAAASGRSATSSTPAAVTTSPTDLLFAANIVEGVTRAAGTGFTSRVITSPDSDIVEDRLVTAAGSYAATAPLQSTAGWVIQMVAFRAAGTGGPDTQPPSAPASLAATAASSSQINLTWTASTDNLGVTGYLVESCTGAGCSTYAQIGTATSTSFSHTGLVAGGTYGYRVRATDAAGNLSGYSNAASATTPAPDTQPPTAPAGLAATAVSTSRINLTWTAATDNVAVTGYLVEGCAGAGCTAFSPIGTATATTFSQTGLAPASSYSYRVRATDAAGNLGDYSGVAGATTLAPDTTPPTSPSNLVATSGSSNRIDLGWTGSTDDVGVASYLVERCQGAGCTGFAQIGSTPNAGYADGAVGPSTTYGYRVRAVDAAGNASGYSNVASATTPTVSVTPSFVQGSYATPQSALATVSVAFPGAQRAGDFNVVVVGWNDTSAQVNSVTDTAGNAYALAIGPTQLAGQLSQSIYYAPNIAQASPGANAVKVVFSAKANYADVRILEYRGIAHASPLDGAAGATGSNATSDSGPVLTANGVDLLVGANMISSLTAGPGPGYTTRFITQPDGDLAEDRVVTTAGSYSATAALAGAGGWVMQLVAFKAAPPDTTPPVVAVTSPASGSVLSGAVSVTATAVDPDSGIQSIQLLVDGAAVGNIASTSPATFSLDTSKFTNGTHAISASAVNGVRTTGYSPPVTATFNNSSPGNPALVGLWSGLVTLPLVPVHVSQMPDARILMNDGQSMGVDAWTWDTTSNEFFSVPVPANIFCSGHEQMADGRIFVGGGHNGGAHIGLPAGTVFDPATETWKVLPNMTYPRWYPTVTTLADGRIFVTSGETSCPECDVPIAEIYNPATNSWTKLTAAPFTFPYYPHVYTLPDGRLLVAGTTEDPIVSQVLDLSRNTWTAVGGPAVDGGASAMYRPSKILKSGTSVNPDDVARPAAATAYVLDMTQASPTWRQVASMNFPRTYHTLTILPDGNVLATGGGPTTAPTDTAHATMPAEIWSPATEAWTTLAPMNAPRLYHSSALLLPDARVLVLGGGRFDNLTLPTDQFNAEIYSPPYLFKGQRPVITSAPSTLPFGQSFTVQTPDAARIASVALLRLASVTHSINMAQRFLPLAFTAGSGSLTVTAPANANLATPGNYMLFLVDTNGVPSVASNVRL
jgi:fibronectin type 3 domain-containing protein